MIHCRAARLKAQLTLLFLGSALALPAWSQNAGPVAGEILTPQQRAQKIAEILKDAAPPAPAVSSFPPFREPAAHPELQAAHDAAPKREVHFILDLPAETAAPEGTITFRYRFTNGTASFPMNAPGRGGTSLVGYPASVTLIKGADAISLPTPITLESLNYEVPGFALEFPANLEIPKGAEPFDFRIASKPAGLIQGRVLGKDGKPLAQPYGVIHLFDLKGPPATQGPAGRGRPSPLRSLPERYIAYPVPLGTTYRVAVIGLQGVAISNPIELSERSPIQQVDVSFASLTETATGRLLQADGKPYPAGLLRLSWQSPWGTIAAGAVTIDGEGKFSLPMSGSLPGSLVIAFSGYGDTDIPAQSFAIAAGANKDFVLQKGAALHGTFVDKATGRKKGPEAVVKTA